MPQPTDYPADGASDHVAGTEADYLSGSERRTARDQLAAAMRVARPDIPLVSSADRVALNALRFAASKHGLPDPAPVCRFALGDVVVLNSGGPLMTVMNPDSAGLVVVVYADRTGIAETCFPAGCLRFPTERELGA